MSIKINWPKFSSKFIDKAKEQLSSALNRGQKPQNIGLISVIDLVMGKTAPELEILDIGDLTEDRFRGTFKLVYAADSYLVIQTKVQANPLSTPNLNLLINNNCKILAADKQLFVPMQLKISNLKLKGIVVLVVDVNKGVTLAFKSDPLESVDVNSSFDKTPSIRKFLQRQIESILRKMFEDDIPQLIHSLSLVYISEKEKSTRKSSSLSEFSTDSAYFSDDINACKRQSQKPTLIKKTNRLFESPESYDLFRTLLNIKQRAAYIGTGLNSILSIQQVDKLILNRFSSDFEKISHGLILNPLFVVDDMSVYSSSTNFQFSDVDSNIRKSTSFASVYNCCENIESISEPDLSSVKEDPKVDLKLRLKYLEKANMTLHLDTVAFDGCLFKSSGQVNAGIQNRKRNVKKVNRIKLDGGVGSLFTSLSASSA